MTAITQEQLASIRNLIEKPLVTLKHFENGTKAISACYFSVVVNFKKVGDVEVYPPLRYDSKPYDIEDAQVSGDDLAAVLFENVLAWKLKHDKIKEKQGVVDAYLSNLWGA